MNLLDSLEEAGQLFPLSIPELRYLKAAADRVRERWPDVQVVRPEKEREALAQKLRDRVERGDWEETRHSFVVAAASAVFDTERRERPDLNWTRKFLYKEIDASTSDTFLSSLLRTYLDSYAAGDTHTSKLAAALCGARQRMSSTGRSLLKEIPELMDHVSGPERLAARMSKMSDPYTELLQLGVRNPHGGGFMDLAHLSLTSHVRPHLSERSQIDWYIKWLRPPGKEEGRNTGAEPAIEALIHPWIDKTPDEELRSYLVETLIELYGDPRIKSGGVWGGIDECYMAIMHRWLTREDMRFFTGVVDATQKNAMWPPRRDFWLKLYDEGKIDAAWAALSSQAFEYARQHLMRQDAKNAYTRVGYQQARQNTSLLIMKIGDKIMVDGCHSYRTHVFDIADPMAPKLFEEGYHCEEIMRASDNRESGTSKSHSSIPSWSRWVRDMINADVQWSRQTQPYTKVHRPSQPKPRYAPPQQPPTSGYTDYRHDRRSVFASDTGPGQFSSRGTMRPPSYTRTTDPVRRVADAPESVVTARGIQPEVSDATSPESGEPASLKYTNSTSLTNRMIAYGPRAAEAVLAYLEGSVGDRTRPALSPESRMALAWVQSVRGDLPRHLRNALEYLLINLQMTGIDLDSLFATRASIDDISAPTPSARPDAVQAPASADVEFPALPEAIDDRLVLLRRHIDAIEGLAMEKDTFEARKTLAKSVKRLKTRSPQLRFAELAELEKLYEQLRQSTKDRRS